MPTFSPPPTAGGRHRLHTPALRPTYAVVSTVGALAFLLFIAAMFFSGPGASWWPSFFPSVPVAGVIGMSGIALAFTIMGLDWVLLGRAINGWPSARAKVTAIEIKRVPSRRAEFLPEVRGKLIGLSDAPEREILLSLQKTWASEKGARKFLARRIADSECTVSVEPAEGERLFLRPWQTPFWLCVLMPAIPWTVLAFFGAGFLGYLKNAPPSGRAKIVAAQRDSPPSHPAPLKPTTPPPRDPREPIAGTITWQIRTEDGRAAEAEIKTMFVAEAGAGQPGREFRIFPTEKARVPGTFIFAIPTGLTGTLSAYPFVEDYAVQGFLAGVKNSAVESFDPEIVLWRLRYAVMRVAINAKGGRALDPSSAPVTRLAASGFGMIPPFHYWDIFQERISWGSRNGDRLIYPALARGRRDWLSGHAAGNAL